MGVLDDPTVATQALAAVDAAPGNAGSDAAGFAFLAAALVIVSLVSVQLARTPVAVASVCRYGCGNGIQRRCQHPAVMLVSRISQDAKRRIVRIDNKMPFDARSATIRWVGPVATPPLAAANVLSSAARPQSICPTACRRSNKYPVQRRPYPRLVPVAQPPPAAHARAAAYFGWKHLPRQARPSHEQDAGQRRPVRQAGTSALRLR